MLRRFDWHLPALPFGCLVATSVVGALVFLLATEEQPATGGAYIEGIAGNPASLNPLLASFNDADRDLTALIFSGLTRLDADGTVRPDLAREWTIADDGKTYTFQLRDDVRWHDQQPVTPGDVAFTVRMLQDRDLKGSPELAALWRKVKVDTPGSGVVRFTLEQPFAPFLSYTGIGILPEHAVGNVAPKDLAAAPFNASPIGTGPFRIAGASLEQVTLDADDAAYDGRPFLDRLGFRFLPDDQALAAALTTRQVEGGLLRPSAGRDAIDRLAHTEAVQAQTAPRVSYSLLFLNTRSTLFKDKAVRRAFAYGIDRQRVVQEAAAGLGVPAEGPIARDSWAFNPDVERYAYDPGKAAAILDQEGWRLGTTGVREKDNQPLKFSLLTNDDRVRVAISGELARQLKQVGVQADVASSGVTGLVQNFLLPRKYDAVLYGIDPGYDPDPYPLWHSSQATGEGLNLAVFAQPAVDKVLEKARVSTDSDERRRLYREFQTAFAQEVPSIPLYHPLYTYVLPKAIKGAGLGLLYDTSSRFRTVRQWYKDTHRDFR